MKKAFNIGAIILINLCLLWIAIVTPSLIIASSRDFYRNEFKENGIYSVKDEFGNEERKIISFIGGEESKKAVFSDTQLDKIIDHITSYLFKNKDSFELVLDNVYIVDEGFCNGVSVFGENAISHMKDVKGLVIFAKVSAIVSAVLLFCLLSVFITKARQSLKNLFIYSRNFYLTLLFFASVFFIGSYFMSNDEIPFSLMLWKNLHYLIFPFQPEKIAGSVLFDTLTCILTTEFFISAVSIVLAVASFVVLLWLLISYFIEKNAKKLSE